MAKIRHAEASEDAELSRILCNAFLPIWNHNWFHCVKEPLAQVPLEAGSIAAELSPLQSARIRFYLSLIKSTRLLGGEVLVTVVDTNKGPAFGAILLWLPPHARMSITSLSTMYHSGLLRTMYDYGLMAVYRIIFVFEDNIEKLFKAADIHEVKHDFVEMLASNSVYAGQGLASQLLRWKIERCQGDVVLDTTTMQAQRAYERMGFKVMGQVEVQTNCDGLGIQLKRGQVKDTKHNQMVMMLRRRDYVE